MRRLKKGAACALAAAMLFSLGITACSSDPAADNVEAVVYEAPNTLKVMREAEPMTESRTMTYEMAKNEYENAQIVFSPSGKVDYYDFEVAPLTSSAGETIGVDAMTVYHQKYIEITKNSSSTAGFPTGWYPDALLPFDTAVEYGENTVAAGDNQSVWVTIKTPETQAAGLYTGTFTLTLDGQEYPISVSARVWDFAVPEENHVRSSFYTFRDYLMNGELDNSVEMYEKYTDFLLDYRVSTDQLPVFDDDLDAYIAAAKKYAADPRCSAYNLNVFGTSGPVPGTDASGPLVNIDRFEAYIRALVENSTPQLNLLDKLYIYWHAIDEPDGQGIVEAALYDNNAMVDKLADIADSYTPQQLDAYGVTADQIRYVEHVVTAQYTPELHGIRTYCPHVSALDLETNRELFQKEAEEAYGGGGTTWWYTCCYPYSPHPNYHIDANLITSRALSWMQRDYGVNGVLYWGTSVYVNVNDGQNRYPRDPYNDPEAFMLAMGDGFLVYPGKPYGIDGPVPSIRLEAIRDGMEDYEYLYMLEELAAKYAKDFEAAGFDIDQILRELYDSIYYGTVADTDTTKLRDARREVAELIELLSSDSHAMILLDRIDPKTETAYIDVYAAAGTTLKVAGEEITGTPSGSGLHFTYELKLTEAVNYFEAEFITGDSTVSISKFIANRVMSLSAFDTQEELSAWTASKGTGALEGYKNDHITLSLSDEQKTEGLFSLKAVIEKYRGSNYENANYLPSITAQASSLWGETSLDDVDTIEFDLYNGTDSAFTVQVFFEAGERVKRVLSVEVSPGWNHVTVSKVYEIDWAQLGETEAISLRFPRHENDQPTIVYVDNMICSFKGE